MRKLLGAAGKNEDEIEVWLSKVPTVPPRLPFKLG
jgi:hypothetical protein